MSKLIVTTDCKECVHSSVCKFTSEVSAIRTDKATKIIEDDLGDLPVRISVTCDNFRKNEPQARDKRDW
jgi:hypothetical protein